MVSDEDDDTSPLPDFDPWDAGIDAEILFLLEAPGARAVASTIVSRNNPDETAKNMFLLHQDACIPRARTLLWNVVPWYIGDGARIRAATPQDLEQGAKKGFRRCRCSTVRSRCGAAGHGQRGAADDRRGGPVPGSRRNGGASPVKSPAHECFRSGKTHALSASRHGSNCLQVVGAVVHKERGITSANSSDVGMRFFPTHAP
jgi:hypothetical protein